jgi:hypothetical protein
MIDRLQEILFRAKKNVFSRLNGSNLSRLKGDGMDLRDIKSYEYGDDIRSINWKATAKSDEIKVNTFDEYKELNILVVFLTSGSIKFGSTTLKQDLMSQVVAFLLYSSIKNRDRAEAIFFSKNCDKKYHSLNHLSKLKEVVEYGLSVEVLKKDIDYKALCNYINKNYKKGHIVVFIGDFLELPDFSTLSRVHQLYGVIIRDHIEESLEFKDEVEIRSPFTLEDEKFFINKSVKNRYKKLIDEHDSKLYGIFNKSRIEYTKIYSDDDIYLKLVGLFR